ncbi:Gag-pol Polyprotein [Phytophthora megakarya]|uniref:Gag-pol Polyprotein n=1 Tax=Phytophthora megakarya TaxID=4795 RepID=A0A225VTN3_9STRA|nr:Gag-pol Polyprotein [Phytophthora megakarya]
MARDVDFFVQRCLHCASTLGGPPQPRLLGEAMHAEHPKELLHWDFLYMGESDTNQAYVLVTHPMCRSWVSDQGTHFKNKVIEALQHAIGGHHHFTTARCPWANGTVEVVNREVLRCSPQEKAFATKKKDFKSKRRFNDRSFYRKKQGHREFECHKKKSDQERGQVAREEVIQDKFVSMKKPKTPVRITITDGSKIDVVAKGTVGVKLMNGTSVKLSDVMYIPQVEGSLISMSKLAEKGVVTPFSEDKCNFRYRDATVMETKSSGNVYKLKTVGDERYEKLLAMAEGEPGITDGVPGDAVCAGCSMDEVT